MPSLIIQHFEPLCAFLLPLIATLSEPQQRHAHPLEGVSLNVVGALLVCPSKHKCLTTLTAMAQPLKRAARPRRATLLRLPHADHFALADFFRQSPWSP